MEAQIKQNINSSNILSYLSSKAVSVMVSNISKSFGGNKVLSDLSLGVKPSETLVILGKSGSGKSVLLKHIVGLLKPDKGNIYINGDDVTKSAGRKKHTIAVVFQSSALLNSLSVKENVALYLTEHKIITDEQKISSLVSSCLSIVGLEGKENIMPSELSGGMKKRVAVARALIMNPDLILFDEPTAGLDPMLVGNIAELINSLKKNVKVTQILVTHNVSLAAKTADRVALLYNGKILKVSTFDEMRLSTEPEIRQFFDSNSIN
ncbi:MAG: ATP-binding cassette domain-containing protein [Candidatus Dadabacteria bacterium]|nr:ATP-binding cassette domain-containing protein [Candidatus Dadabacteria bacterium]NIX15544.1 ATP-binding cassette domain-containing protein [Candidatus Dadabacteria bacterium]NIY22284.1 ATP-binding cassette domain-containing protein [Candidatus Dadabacteria bacterium]